MDVKQPTRKEWVYSNLKKGLLIISGMFLVSLSSKYAEAKDIYYKSTDGSKVRIGNTTLIKSFVLNTPIAGSVAIWRTPEAITITAVRGVQVGGTNVIGMLTECDANGLNPVKCNSSDMTITTSNTNQTSFTNGSIDAGDYIGWTTTSVSGNVEKCIITFEYEVN